MVFNSKFLDQTELASCSKKIWIKIIKKFKFSSIVTGEFKSAAPNVQLAECKANVSFAKLARNYLQPDPVFDKKINRICLVQRICLELPSHWRLVDDHFEDSYSLRSSEFGYLSSLKLSNF